MLFMTIKNVNYQSYQAKPLKSILEVKLEEEIIHKPSIRICSFLVKCEDFKFKYFNNLLKS